MNKRLIIIIIIILLLLGVVGVLMYFAANKQKPEPVQAGPQIKKILDEPVVSPIPAFDNSSIWYFNREGRLFSMNLDGSGLSEFPLPSLSSNLKKILWPPASLDFIAITADDNKSYYNNDSKIYLNLPSNIQSLDWLPDGHRVVYIWKSGDNQHQQLVMADADATGFKSIADVFWPDLIVKAGLDGKTALLYRSVPESNVNKIYSIDLNTGQFNTVIDTGSNISVAWLSTSRFIYSQAAENYRQKLYIYDFTKQQSTDLSLNSTIEKTVFDKNANLLFAVVSKDDNSGDKFVKIDLTNLKQEVYFEPTSSVRAANLFMIGNNLYFVNLQDQKLYSISK